MSAPPLAPVAPSSDGSPPDVEIGLDQHQQLVQGPLHLRMAIARSMIPVDGAWPAGLDALREAVEVEPGAPRTGLFLAAMVVAGIGVGLGVGIAAGQPGESAPVVAAVVTLLAVAVAALVVWGQARRPQRFAEARLLAVEALRCIAFVHRGPDGRVVHVAVPRLALLDVTAPLSTLLEQAREALAEAEAATTLRSEAAGTVLDGVVPDLSERRADLIRAIALLESTRDELREVDAALAEAAASAAGSGQPGWQRDIGRDLARGRSVLQAVTPVVHGRPPGDPA
ncbi:MAG: hypothetical protein H6742_19285 [Alphaproteobacteria bacterium]|nr:hypothetical protein [Alphaproteobacteria bacterium]